MTLDQCGDVVSGREFMQLLQCKPAKFYLLKRHGLLPDPLPGFTNRYSKVAIAAYLANPVAVTRRLRRSA